MTIRPLALCLLLFFTPAALAELADYEEFSERFNQVRELVAQEKYAQASSAFEQLYEQSASVDRAHGVRNSFLVGAWHELGQEYAPALEALKVKRQELLELALSDSLTFETFSDLSSINRVLGDDSLTLDVFKQVHNKHPEQAEQLYFAAADLLIQHGEYDLLMHYNPDPIFSFESARYSREGSLSSVREGVLEEGHKRRADQRFERTLTALLLALEQSGRGKELAEVRRRAETYYGREQVQALLDQVQERD